MAADQGIDFRATSGYVTDPANCTYCIGDGYPTVRGTFTFGFQTAIASQTRDRDSAVSNKRLAGINYDASTTNYFQLDLDATGSTDIHAAFGDASNSVECSWTIRDSATSFQTITGPTTGVAKFKDATNVERTSVADWTTNEAANTQTMSTTALRIYPVNTNNNEVAFLRSVQSGGGGSAVYRRRGLLGVGQ